MPKPRPRIGGNRPGQVARAWTKTHGCGQREGAQVRDVQVQAQEQVGSQVEAQEQARAKVRAAVWAHAVRQIQAAVAGRLARQAWGELRQFMQVEIHGYGNQALKEQFLRESMQEHYEFVMQAIERQWRWRGAVAKEAAAQAAATKEAADKAIADKMPKPRPRPREDEISWRAATHEERMAVARVQYRVFDVHGMEVEEQ